METSVHTIKAARFIGRNFNSKSHTMFLIVQLTARGEPITLKIVLHKHTCKNLLLRSILFTLLYFTLPIGRHSRLPIFTRCRWHKLITALKAVADTEALQHRWLQQRTQLNIVVRNGKVECAEPVVSLLVGRWLDDTVDGGFVITSREKFQAVTSVDDLSMTVMVGTLSLRTELLETYECILDVSDPPPFPVGGFDL